MPAQNNKGRTASAGAQGCSSLGHGVSCAVLLHVLTAILAEHSLQLVQDCACM